MNKENHNEIIRAIGQIEGTLKTGLKSIDDRFLSIDKKLEKTDAKIENNEKKINIVENWQHNTMGKVAVISSAIGLFVMFISGVIKDWLSQIFKNN